MKNIIIALSLLVSSLTVQAQTSVKVYWPFPVGDGQSLYLRSLLDQANRIQTDYVFVLVSTPGAGGLLAVKNAHNSNSLSLLAHTSAYFIRPLVYSQGRYEFSLFRPLVVVGETPFAVVTQLNHHGPVNKIGVAGLGSTTHVISVMLKSRYPDLEIIPYKGLSDSLHEVRNGMIDASLNFVRAVEQYEDLRIVGTTGTNRISGYALLRDIFAEDMAHLNSPLFVMSRADMPASQFDQIQSLLVQARNTDSQLQKMVAQDHAVLSDMSPALYDQWYEQQISNYRRYVSGITLD